MGSYALCGQYAHPFLLFCPFLKLFGFKELDVLLVTQVVHSIGCPQGVLVARVTPMAGLQFLSLDQGLSLLLHSVATMLLVKGYAARSGNSCQL